MMKNEVNRALCRAKTKLFFKLSMLLFVLAMSTNVAWATEGNIYFVSLKAQADPISTGSGQVKLTWVDITGKQMESAFALALNNAALGNNATVSGPADNAQLAAGTLFALDGLESYQPLSDQLYATSYAYFHAEAVPAAGSYFAGWTFLDPAITRIDTAMGNGESIAFKSPCFKVLPNAENVAAFTDETTAEDYETKKAAMFAVAQNVAQNKYNNLYAVFKKYLLSNPVATSANMGAVENETADLAVTVEINGEAATLDAADFATFTFTNNGSSEWAYDLAAALAAKEVVSDQKTRITIPVTYTYKNTGFGLKNTTMAILMAGENPSTLNVNLSVNALNPTRPEAFLFDGETAMETEKLTLEELLAVDISGYAKPILKLNKPVDIDLTFSGKTFTLDLNGNDAGEITINGGEITIAYSKFGGEAASLTVNGGKAILNGGTFGSMTIGESGTVEQNGAVIGSNEVTTNEGSLTVTNGEFLGGLVSSGVLTLNGGYFMAEKGNAVEVEDGTAVINRGTLSGAELGLLVSGGTVTVNKLAVITSEDGDDESDDDMYSVECTGGGVLNVVSGKFGKPLHDENDGINFTAGFFKDNNYGVSTTGLIEMNVSAGVEYNEGYRYFLGTAETAKANGVGVCRIGNVSYATLEDAIAYANNNPSVENIVIFMTNNYTLPAGYYTLPANATIVVPMSDTQAKEINTSTPRVVYNDLNNDTYETPSEFRRLTFASGVNMDVFGDIELTCTQLASNEAYTSQPTGPYGHLVLVPGSHITLQSGSELRAWGFVTGDGSTDENGIYLSGEIDARRGSKVREMFQMGDWKGAMTSVFITGLGAPLHLDDYSDKKIFPVTQYFIQNVESPVKYHPGAVLSTSASVSEGIQQFGLSVSMCAADIKVVGVSGEDEAIFLMGLASDAENTWVRKWYDAKNDIQTYEINSAAHIGSMVIDLGELSLGTLSVPVRLNSAKFDLPITSNMKIHLLSGTMDFEQNTCLLPGAEVEVDKESVVSISMSSEDKEKFERWKAAIVAGEDPEPADTVLYSGAVYVFDQADWDTYAYNNQYTKVVWYAASLNGQPTKRAESTCPPSAAINVHGTFNTQEGYVYTSEHGANIFSTNADAGTFIFNQDASIAGSRTVYQIKGLGNAKSNYEPLTLTSAKLKNGAGVMPAYAETSTADVGDAYCYLDSKWTILKVDDDNPCFMIDNYGTYYAKPAEYTAVVAKKQLKKDNGELVVDNDGNPVYEIAGNADHTYSDRAGTGRLFILMEESCQWWEVEKEDNLYHCTHPLNDTYYYWDADAEMWMEKKFTITWRNWDGTIVQTADEDGHLQDYYEVKYGTQAEFFGTTPTREKDIDYTYDFTGWNPTPGKVTNNVTYTATYTAKDRMYTIIFLQEGGSEIERQFLKHNDVPVCENTPARIGYTLQWSPAIAAVTGDATYTATWLENPPTEYEVTFYDYNGTTVLQQSNVDVGAMPTPPTITAGIPAGSTGKPATSEFTYVFDHWSPALEEVSATSIKSYTAVYREVAQTYKVRFYQADGTTQIGDDQNLAYGAMPIAPASNLVTEPGEEGYTYTYIWQNKADDTKTVETVKAAADYKAVFSGAKNKYTVTLSCATPGGCTFTGAGIYEHGTSVTIAAIPNRGYEFVKWQETESTVAALDPQTITGDITLTAVVNAVIPPTPTDLTVGINGIETIASATDYANLTITSDGIAHSGQIINADNIDLLGNADFILSKSFAQRTWYCVAVPWRVEANGGIYIGNSATPAMLGTDIEIIYYDGDIRANQGKVDACWVYMKNVSGKKILEPGRAYMIALYNTTADKITFRKKAFEPLLTEVTAVQSFPQMTGNPVDGGWNAIANPALFHAYVNAGSTDAAAQRYNAATGQYEWFYLNAHALVVGEPIYVQAPSNKSIVVENGADYAPARRTQAQAGTKFDISVTSYGANAYADHLCVRLNEEKEEDAYVIGQDLAKFGVSNMVAQMWINRYDAKLCINTVAPEGETTSFPMSLYAPISGDYTVALESSINADNYALYLTYDGQAICNLTESAYTLSVRQGTDSRYGLRISVKKAPQVETGVDEAIVNAQGETRKVLINNQVFIIRGEKVYSIDGQLVK